MVYYAYIICTTLIVFSFSRFRLFITRVLYTYWLFITLYIDCRTHCTTNIPQTMDLTGKGYPPNYLRHPSGLVAAYGLGQTPLTTSVFKPTSHSIPSPDYSGSLTSSRSPSHAVSHTSFSNGHNLASLHHQADKLRAESETTTKSQLYATGPSPVFKRLNQSFSYGLGGVSMSNYSYPGDVFQYTSNGYPRKSRTCSYCGKVFTRSTTRRYHEKRCPLLRAAVSSYMGEDNTSPSGSTNSQSGVRSVGDLVTHSYKAQGQTLGPSLSGINRSNEPQELSTSVLAKSPPSGRRSGGDKSVSSGYHTSVIVKKEHHEMEALANLSSSSSKHRMSDTEEGEINHRKHKGDANVNLSPAYSESMLNLTMSKSPQRSSPRSDSMPSHESYMQSRYGARIDDCQGGQALPPHQAFLRDQRYNIDLTREGDDVDKKMLDSPKSDMFSSTNGQDDKTDQMSDLGSGVGESESVASDKRDGKIYNNHKCGICGKGFESSGKLHLHEQLHTKFKPYSCKFCGQKFAKAAQRVEHEKTHSSSSEEVTHTCAVCGTTFTRKYSLKLHMRRWHGEGPWLCRHCGKASMSQKDLKTHLYSHNLPRQERESLMYLIDGPLNYGATSLEDSGGEDKDMEEGEDNEVTTSHDPPTSAQNQQEMEMCNECGRDFPKGYLRYHLKSHEAQKPYSCPICAKRFGYKNNMKSHIKLHTGIKPFQCKVCGAKFTRGSTLRRHARRHGIVADTVWDLFVKPNYKSSGAGQSVARTGTKHDTLSTSCNDSNGGVGGGPSTGLGSNAADGGDSSYLPTSLASTPASHSSLYPLYASLGQLPHLGLYPGLTSASYFTPHIPPTSIYAASSQLQPQHNALNLSLNKGPVDHSDQSSFSNVSAEGMRSRSCSLSGSDNRRLAQQEAMQSSALCPSVGVQVNLCCPPASRSPKDLSLGLGLTMKQEDNSGRLSGSSSATAGAVSPSSMALVPYIVSSPSQRQEAASPALSSSSGKDYSLETISSLISTGRMFKCFHCECYFSEYAMYRIHSKLHIDDETRPFVCKVCGEDCHDRVYFALHLSEHIR